MHAGSQPGAAVSEIVTRTYSSRHSLLGLSLCLLRGSLGSQAGGDGLLLSAALGLGGGAAGGQLSLLWVGRE